MKSDYSDSSSTLAPNILFLLETEVDFKNFKNSFLPLCHLTLQVLVNYLTREEVKTVTLSVSVWAAVSSSG